MNLVVMEGVVDSWVMDVWLGDLVKRKRTVGWFVLISVVVAEALTVGLGLNWVVVVVCCGQGRFLFAVHYLVGRRGSSSVSYLGQKMPNTKANIIHCGRDDKLDILGEVIFVVLEKFSSSLRVIAP